MQVVLFLSIVGALDQRAVLHCIAGNRHDDGARLARVHGLAKVWGWGGLAPSFACVRRRYERRCD